MSPDPSDESDQLLDHVPGNLDEINRLLKWVDDFLDRCPRIGKRLGPVLDLEDLPAEVHASLLQQLQHELIELDSLLLDAQEERLRCVAGEPRGRVESWLVNLARANKELLEQMKGQTVNDEVVNAITRFASLLGSCRPDLEDLAQLLVTTKTVREKHQKPAKRSCYERDHTFLKWRTEGLTPAKIRDRWNREHADRPEDQIGQGEQGSDIVKKGIKTARREEQNP
jgi:hypothetical protein